jgi:hypothetical protein
MAVLADIQCGRRHTAHSMHQGCAPLHLPICRPQWSAARQCACPLRWAAAGRPAAGPPAVCPADEPAPLQWPPAALRCATPSRPASAAVGTVTCCQYQSCCVCSPQCIKRRTRGACCAGEFMCMPVAGERLQEQRLGAERPQLGRQARAARRLQPLVTRWALAAGWDCSAEAPAASTTFCSCCSACVHSSCRSSVRRQASCANSSTVRPGLATAERGARPGLACWAAPGPGCWAPAPRRSPACAPTSRPTCCGPPGPAQQLSRIMVMELHDVQGPVATPLAGAQPASAGRTLWSAQQPGREACNVPCAGVV